MNLVLPLAAFVAIGTTSVPAASAAQAQGGLRPRSLRKDPTPDGTPPALEDVCDDYKDYKKPYGICVAYCEAEDCDDDDSKQTSCEALKDAWRKITGKTDLPCESTTTTAATTTTGTSTTTITTPGTTTAATTTEAPGLTCDYSCCTNNGCENIPKTGCDACDMDSDCWDNAAFDCLLLGGPTKILRVGAPSTNVGSFQGNKSCQDLADDNGMSNGQDVCKAAEFCYFEYCSDENLDVFQCTKAKCAMGCGDDDCTAIVEEAIAKVQCSLGFNTQVVQPSSKFTCISAQASQDQTCPATTTTPPITSDCAATTTEAPEDTCDYSCCTKTGCEDLPQVGCSNDCDTGSACWKTAELLCRLLDGPNVIFQQDAPSSKTGSFQGNKSCQDLADDNGKPNGQAVCNAAEDCYFEYCSDDATVFQCAKTFCAMGCGEDCTDIQTKFLEDEFDAVESTVVIVDKLQCITDESRQDKACPATTTATP